MTSKCILLWLCWWSTACASCRLCPEETGGWAGRLHSPGAPQFHAPVSAPQSVCWQNFSTVRRQGCRRVPGLTSVCIFRGRGWLTQRKDCQHPVPLGGSLLCLHGGERSSQLGNSGAAGRWRSGQGLSLRAVVSLASLSAVAGKEDWQDFTFVKFTVNWFVA